MATSLLLMLTLVALTEAYHDPFVNEHSDSHCWPLNASSIYQKTIDCQGLHLEWVEEPPHKVYRDELMNISVMVSANETFYTPALFPRITNNTDSTLLQEFCTDECSVECDRAKEKDCCVWHANVHICHPLSELCGDEPVCGPWLANDTVITTQTANLCGGLGLYNAQIRINVPGFNTILYHLRVGHIQIVLGAQVFITDYSCGDGRCSTIESCSKCPDDSEAQGSCSQCEEDCCPISPGVIAGSVVSPVSVILIITLIILILIVVIFRNKKKQLNDTSWIISYDDIIIEPALRSSIPSMRHSHRDVSSAANSIMMDYRYTQIFTETGKYKGRVVSIKRVPKRDFTCTDFHCQLRKEVIEVRSLDHSNLCKFIGATILDPTPNTAIITEYCPKGSINDVLLNDDIPLNWNFRFSFAQDIARGMSVLHSHHIIHGRLCSSNCLIDDRWVTKITDFGLPSLREEEGRRPQMNVYSAPECRGSGQYGVRTPPSDVYSYAIILYEIATRVDPYSEDLQLDANKKPSLSLSHLSENECPCPQQYLELVHRCWTFSPLHRPSFDTVKRRLHHISPYRDSPVDNMMIMMEKYSKHLEQLVNERTQELNAEQERATKLLYSMLPKRVAEDLKNGQATGATSFSSSTIFFSDIVGFTNLAGTSTPMQVVRLLNNLYSEFDSILDKFDVYKIETIGDSYMVVSGVPTPNGDRHAGEIARMALQLMASCKHFTIPHQSGKRLEIRAGIHSGPVCAGVVGTKMPRYCLFGDTVNTASRMESTSKAMHIQCSESTYQLLSKLGGFEMESRGTMEVKGKGDMKTWWIVSSSSPLSLLEVPSSIATSHPIREAPRMSSSYLLLPEQEGREGGGSKLESQSFVQPSQKRSGVVPTPQDPSRALTSKSDIWGRTSIGQLAHKPPPLTTQTPRFSSPPPPPRYSITSSSKTSLLPSPPPQIIFPTSPTPIFPPPPRKHVHGRPSKDSISSHDLQLHLPGSAAVED